MICELCCKEDKKSRVYPGTRASTAMASEQYYDEEGLYHFHDVNSHSTSYSCSEGHRWSETPVNRCLAEGCDWTMVPTAHV